MPYADSNGDNLRVLRIPNYKRKIKMYFDNLKTSEQLRDEYKRLVKEMHPDKGGDVSAFQAMQSEYEEALKNLLKKSRKHSVEWQKVSELLLDLLKEVNPDLYKKVKNALYTPLGRAIIQLASPKIKELLDLFI